MSFMKPISVFLKVQSPLRALIVLVVLSALLSPEAGAAEAGADPFHSKRMKMVERDIVARGITDIHTLKAMREVKRHLFVPLIVRSQSYSDFPLPIGKGQTISQPYTVAFMTEKLSLDGSERVLEIGTGSGYQAAVLAEIGAEVRSIEIIKSLAESAGKRLAELGFDRVKVRHADGYYGWPEEAPFDAIIVTAAANHVPPPLLDQLRDGGRLIIPLGSTRYHQALTLITKSGEDFYVEHMMGVVFVPMVGKMTGDE